MDMLWYPVRFALRSLRVFQELLQRETFNFTCHRLFACMCGSYKDLQGQHDDLLRTVSSLRSENEQLYAQRRDLEMRLAFVGSAVPASSGAANAFSGVTASGARRVSGVSARGCLFR